MIFARRALQRRVNDLRTVMSAEAVDALVDRLNRMRRDRMAAVWEVVVIHALTRLGKVALEAPLETGRRPDVAFAGPIDFTADITTVSDEGLDEANPWDDLMVRVEVAKTKLGLPIGGLDLRVEEQEVVTSRGRLRRLRLPPRPRLDTFIAERIVPELRAQMDAGRTVLRLVIDDESASLTLTIDPAQGHYNSGGYAPYAAPTILDSNPLYRALRSKAKQLKGAEGRTGIVVGDASSQSLRPTRGRGEVAPQDIVGEFLRQNSSIGFVVLLTIHEASRPILSAEPPSRTVRPIVITRTDDADGPALEQLFGAAVALMPVPAMMPVNGALRAMETGYDIGNHGGFHMNDHRIRISARELVETLAGLRTFGDDGAKFVEARRKHPSTSRNLIEGWFLRRLTRGQLPTGIRVVKGGEDDNDDWIEFDFGPKDPAIAPFE